MNRLWWPEWLALLEQFHRTVEPWLWVVLTPEEAEEAARYGLLWEERVVSRDLMVARRVKYPDLSAVIWVKAPAVRGERIYSLWFGQQKVMTRVEAALKRECDPSKDRWRKVPWDLTTKTPYEVAIFDDLEEERFYMNTQRPPPEYPGHFWYYSGWTYDRGRNGVELCLALESSATKYADKQRREAAHNRAVSKRRVEQARREVEQRRLHRDLQAALWDEILRAADREAKARGEQIEDDE